MMQSFAIESLIRSETSRLLSMVKAAAKENIVKDTLEDANESQCSSSNDSNTFADCAFSSLAHNANSNAAVNNIADYANVKLNYSEELKKEPEEQEYVSKITHHNQYLSRSSPIGKLKL